MNRGAPGGFHHDGRQLRTPMAGDAPEQNQHNVEEDLGLRRPMESMVDHAPEWSSDNHIGSIPHSVKNYIHIYLPLSLYS